MAEILEQQINFYQAAFSNPRSLFDLSGLLQLTAIIICGMLSLYGWSLWQSHQLANKRSQMHEWLAQRSLKLTEKSTASSQNNHRQQLLNEFQRLEQQRLQSGKTMNLLKQASQQHQYGASDFMASLARKVPPGLWLTRFSIDGKGKSVVIHGQSKKAALVPQFITRLSDEKGLQGIHFAQLEIENDKDDQYWIDFTLRSEDKKK